MEAQEAITRLGSHFTNNATARARPSRIYSYIIKTPDVLVYIFPNARADPPRVNKRNASLVRQTCPFRRYTVSLPGHYPWYVGVL